MLADAKITISFELTSGEGIVIDVVLQRAPSCETLPSVPTKGYSVVGFNATDRCTFCFGG